MRRTQIILVDSDCRRRAKVAFELTNLMSYVLPLEDVGEICGAWPDQAVVLVEDEADNVTRLTRMMRRQQKPLPFIAFAPKLDKLARARALAKGAVAYLNWPVAVEAINDAVLAALSSATKGMPRTEPERSSFIGLACESDVSAVPGSAATGGNYLVCAPHPATARVPRKVVPFQSLRSD